MGNVRRIYVEKKKPFAVKATELHEELKNYLGINVDEVRIFIPASLVSDTFERDLNKLVFYDKQQNIISLEMLSAGEKQLLLILLSVFLMDEKPSVLLMDEPELSLHIAWQEKLISALRKLNPVCQIILTTHSPSIFALGWENNLTFMEELYKPLRDA